MIFECSDGHIQEAQTLRMVSSAPSSGGRLHPLQRDSSPTGAEQLYKLSSGEASGRDAYT